MLECFYCKKRFYRADREAARSNRHFCSRTCFHLGGTKNKITRTCPICKSKFEVLESKLEHSPCTYCSVACRNEGKKRRKNCVCLKCSKEFFVPYSALKNGGGKYCSKECKFSGLRGKNNPRYTHGLSLHEKYGKSLKDKKCVVCDSQQNVYVHHLDGNRQHNEIKNWILVCNSCHRRIHSLISKYLLPAEKAFDLFKNEKLNMLGRSKFNSYAPSDEALERIGLPDHFKKT